MKQLFCVIYISVLLVCFLRLILHLCICRLFWRANQMSKSRRFVSRTLAVFYGGFL